MHEGQRVIAAGQQLIEIHIWLREELARLREDAGAGPIDLRAHCLAFCQAVSKHHTSEDSSVFAVLESEFPHLKPVLAELTRDHVMVGKLLTELEQASEAGAPQAHLDTIAALLEVHFRYEERKLADALNSLSTEVDLGDPRGGDPGVHSASQSSVRPSPAAAE